MTRKDLQVYIKEEHLSILHEGAKNMQVVTFTKTIKTEGATKFTDITEVVLQAVRQSEISNGIVTVYSQHTTAAIKINENEPLLLRDLECYLERIAPATGSYNHNDFSVRTVNMQPGERPNAHAHLQQILLSTSETIPLVNSVLQLGRWQSIFLIELDMPLERTIIIQILGY